MNTPTDIKLRRAENVLEVSFTDGSVFRLTAEYLRTQSPSAEVQGHGPDERQLVFGKKNVAITGVVPTGNYAVRLVFSDGHETGIFTWDYLYALGQEFSTRWPDYLQQLEAAGRRRD
ncbi:MAG TPA: DUF971 domain-containing protein [Acidocella sp.]|jgi:DUF971 family protein|nr:DUF971 domain-containing protein [Acidocella sp.]